MGSRLGWLGLFSTQYDSPLISDNISKKHPFNQNEVEASLLFDGKQLHWLQGRDSKSWNAYSGNEKYFKTNDFSIAAQQLKNAGPIPEGFYLLHQSNFSTYSIFAEYIRKEYLNGPSWRGGPDAWGYQRVAIEPYPSTNTYGRGGFFVHGGSVPGSAGCIDLVDKMEEFSKLFRDYKKSIKLEVRYNK